MRAATPVMDRIMSKVQVDVNGCWRWTGHKSHLGYARIAYQGRAVSAHRVAYEHTIGVIPATLEIDHLCCVRDCVNPAHMEPVTHAENVRRAAARMTHFACGHPITEESTRYDSTSGARRCAICRPPKPLACPQGHEFAPENTIRDTKGARRCRICRKEQMARAQKKYRSRL